MSTRKRRRSVEPDTERENHGSNEPSDADTIDENSETEIEHNKDLRWQRQGIASLVQPTKRRRRDRSELFGPSQHQPRYKTAPFALDYQSWLQAHAEPLDEESHEEIDEEIDGETITHSPYILWAPVFVED